LLFKDEPFLIVGRIGFDNRHSQKKKTK